MKKTAIALAVALASLATVAQAAPQSQTWYAGAKAGWSRYYSPALSNKLDQFNAKSPKKNDIGGGVFVGYQANRFVAFELGYDWLGKLKYRNQAAGTSEPHASVSGTEISAKLSYPVSQKLDIYTRLGGFIWNNHFRGGNVSEKDSGLSPLFALGAEYAITPALSTRLDYQWVNKVGDFNSVGVKPNNGLLSLGVVYHFGQQTAKAALAPVVTLKPVTPVVPVKKATVQTKQLNLSETVWFNFNQSSLTQAGKSKLDALYTNLVKSGDLNDHTTAVVIGHTDRIGSTKANQDVSMKRAQAVAAYLISKGMPKQQITVEGLGNANPVTANKCNSLTGTQLKTCLAPDRRVVITIKTSDAH